MTIVQRHFLNQSVSSSPDTPRPCHLHQKSALQVDQKPLAFDAIEKLVDLQYNDFQSFAHNTPADSKSFFKKQKKK